jgi:hypothetical protein
MTDKEDSSQTKIMTQNDFEMQKITLKPITFYLLILGTVLILLAVLLKVEIQGQKFSNLTPFEFTVLVASAISLFFLSSLVRLYQYRRWQEIIKEQQKLAQDLMRLQKRVNAIFYKKSLRWQEIIKEQQRLAQDMKQLKERVYKKS